MSLTIKFWHWLKNIDLLILVSALLIVTGTWSFVGLLDEVQEGDTHNFDEAILRAVGQWQLPAWMEEIGRDLTALGGIAVLSLVTLAVAGYLVLERKHHALVLLFIATLGALVLSFYLKDLINRPRPDIIPHRTYVMTRSFPSGHSMLSASVYLTLGTLLSRLTDRWLLRTYFVGIALLITGLVGLSRVFLGVHWPSDVLGGWTAGLVWAILCGLISRFFWKQETESVNRNDSPRSKGT